TVNRAKHDVTIARAGTRIARNRVRQETRVVAVRVSQVRALRAQLVASHSRLAGARAEKRQSLASLTDQERSEVEEIDALQAESAKLEAQIRAAQAPPPPAGSFGGVDTTPSSAGLTWPVNGPVTSPFGMRWGRMHTGIDIGVPSGTPVHASAAGTVIYASWMEGYGNFVIIDHGGGIATAYAHNTSLAVAVGQSVQQDEVIAYSGS